MFKQCAVLSLMAIMSINAFAMEGGDEERGDHAEQHEIEDAHHGEDEEHVINACSFARVWQAATAGCQMARNLLLRMLAGLGTPKGAIIVTSCYGITTGISNFLWAFNWKAHANTSDEVHAILQEIGGLSASAESFLFGLLFPIVIYEITKHHGGEE